MRSTPVGKQEAPIPFTPMKRENQALNKVLRISAQENENGRIQMGVAGFVSIRRDRDREVAPTPALLNL
jgi:hypothetical protein